MIECWNTSHGRYKHIDTSPQFLAVNLQLLPGTVDAKHPVIVDALAHGTGSGQELLLPVIKAIKNALTDEQALIAPTDASPQTPAITVKPTSSS